jgi:hypothetical protein
VATKEDDIKKTLAIFGCLAITLLLVAALAFGNIAKALQSAENDDPFDVEAYNGVLEDGLEVLPLGDFYPPIKFEFQYTFDVDGSLFGDTSTSTDSNATLEEQYSAEEQFQKKESEKETPRANIQLASFTIEPGGEVVATAQPQNFDTRSQGEDLFYAWALDDVSLAGVAAGADPLDLPQASSPKDEHTRATNSDSDGDGMDDEWEVRYGLNPNSAGDAGGDLDRDGFTNTFYDNADGEILIVEPPTSGGEPGGALTNLKEYIWGTDPTNPDTDGDGFTDGQDIAGLGQLKVSLMIPSTAGQGDSFDLRLTVLGHSLQRFDRDTPLVKLDSSVQELAVTSRERVSAKLNISNPSPIPGETVVLETQLAQTEFHEGLLSYNWFVNNVLQEEESGESEFTLAYRVPPESSPGDVITFSVQALNLQSGQSADATLEVRVGEVVQLLYDPTDVVEGQSVTVTATMLNQSDPGDLVFHWTKNGTEVVDQSGQGKTTFTTEIEDSAGSQFDIALRVTTPEDSKEFGSVNATVEVMEPQVDIVSDTSYPFPGQIVQLVAIPKFFSNDDLTYRWTVNGQIQQVEPESSEFSFPAEGQINEVVEIGVVVTSQGSGVDTARASEFLTMTAGGQISATSSGASRQALASLREAVFENRRFVGLFAGAFIGTLAIVVLVLTKRHVW